MSTSQPPGTRWQLSEFLSPARLNRKNLTIDTAANLDAITDWAPNSLVVATTPGGTNNWVVDVLYMRNNANTGWVSASGGVHLHNSTSSSAGGLFSDIVYANQEALYWDHHNNVTASDFVVDSQSGGGAINPDPANARVAFVAPNNGYVSGARSGVGIAYVLKSKLLVRMQVSASNNLTCRVGVTSPRVDEALSGTFNQQYGMEVCDSAGNPMDWSCYAAAGTTARDTQTATGSTVAPARMTGYKLIYLPGDRVQFYVDSTLKATVTGSVPISGDILNHPRNIGVGIRGNAAARTLWLSGISFSGRAATTTTSGWF